MPVQTTQLAVCEFNAPLPVRIHSPLQPNDYAVVLFQHGFMTEASAYDKILRHVAGHGFVVVAPQMYAPGIGPLLGSPTAAQEAEHAQNVLAWMDSHLSEVTGVSARTDRLGVAGHSRGGKVAWLLATSDENRIRAIAGVDPVDGRGGPAGNQARAIVGTFTYSFPSLVIGAGLGGSCAPAGDNHVEFYNACPSPAWHVVVPEAGHADMLDESVATLAANVCATGGRRAEVRALTAGLLVAFFRSALQSDAPSADWLNEVANSPLAIENETK